MSEKEILKKILSIITSDDINKTDAENHDIAFLAMQVGDEDLALNIINNPKFNSMHINKREHSDETLLTTAAYFGCAKVIKTLLDDKELIEITNQSFSPFNALIEPFRSFKPQQYEFPSFSKEILDKARRIESTIPLRLNILDMLLQQEELTLTSNDFLGYIYLRDERYNSKIPFSNSKLYYFSKDTLEKIISNCKCKNTEWLYNDEWRMTALGNVGQYCSLEEVKLFLKRDDIDINKTFPATRRLYFRNAATETLGCDSYRGRILSLSNRINEDNLYKIVLDKRFSSVLTLDIINRLEYSEIVNKEKIINTILINKDWPKEDIYDETALSLAFYHDNINYEFLINHENVRLKTNTLEFISKYASKYNYYYGYEFPEKIKEASIIKDITDLELTKRTDRWTKVDELTYDTIAYRNGLYIDSDKRMGRALEESFLEQEQVKKIIKERLVIAYYNLTNRYVPNVNINALSYIINENELVKEEINSIRKLVEELLDNYHYIEVTDSYIKEEDSRQKKKTLFDKLKKIASPINKI